MAAPTVTPNRARMWMGFGHGDNSRRTPVRAKAALPRVAGHARTARLVGSAPAGSVRQTVPQDFGDLEVVTDGEPDDLGVFAGVERLVDRPTTKRGKDMICGDRGRTRRSEMAGHQSAEFGQSHAVTLLRRPAMTVGPGG